MPERWTKKAAEDPERDNVKKVNETKAKEKIADDKFSAVDNSENANAPYGEEDVGTEDVPDVQIPLNVETAPSTFLFIGPVGKKRLRCRTETTDAAAISPTSIQSMSNTPSLIEIEETCENNAKWRDMKENGERESLPKMSIPTSVICSVPKGRRYSSNDVNIRTRSIDENQQPLNLSLPTETQSSSHFHSPSNQEERESVINIAPLERFQEDSSEDSQSLVNPVDIHIYEDYYEDEGSNVAASTTGSETSPTPHLTTIVTSRVEPSSFQGLLMTNPQTVGTSQPSTSAASINLNLKKKLVCRDCGKEFSQLRNYKYHRSRHEGTHQFACTCPVCGKSFNDKGYLSSHLKIHRNEKEYKCEWCEKSFNQRVAYNMHIRIHTGHKPHVCSFEKCHKAFSRKMLLRQHVRTHTGERPYTCNVCGKAFADRSNMLLHQRLHSGERPYKCHICGKSFSKNHHLKTHLNHHAGIKPYQCEKCKASFSQSSNMKTHFRKCSGNHLPASAATSTVTSGDSEISSYQPSTFPPLNESSRDSFRSLILEEELEQRLQRMRQLQLTTTQQLQEVTTPLRLSPPVTSPQRINPRGISPSNSLSLSLGGSSSSGTTQSLGFNLGSMTLTSPVGGRRASEFPLLPLSTNPSTTSLAAGHPFIPLTGLEGNLGTGQSILSPSHRPPSPSSISMSSRSLLSPRHLQPHGDLGASTFPQMQSSQQRRNRTRSLSRSGGGTRMFQRYSNTFHQQPQRGESDEVPSRRQQSTVTISTVGDPHPLLYPISPRPRQSTRAPSQSPQEYFEVFLPALEVSTSLPRQIVEQFGQQQLIRNQDMHRIYRIENPSRSQQHQQQYLQSQNQSQMYPRSQTSIEESSSPSGRIQHGNVPFVIESNTQQSTAPSILMHGSLSQALGQRLRALRALEIEEEQPNSLFAEDDSQ